MVRRRRRVECVALRSSGPCGGRESYARRRPWTGEVCPTPCPAGRSAIPAPRRFARQTADTHLAGASLFAASAKRVAPGRPAGCHGIRARNATRKVGLIAAFHRRARLRARRDGGPPSSYARGGPRVTENGASALPHPPDWRAACSAGGDRSEPHANAGANQTPHSHHGRAATIALGAS